MSFLKKTAQYVIILCFSLLILAIGVYGVECYFYYKHIDMKPAFRVVALQEARHLGIDYDTRTKRQVVRDFRRDGVQAWPAMFPNVFLTSHRPLAALLPFSGISNVHTVVGNENGYFWTYTSDRYGFNNPDDVHNKSIEIAFLGDSFTHGSEVKHGCAVDVVRDAYPKTANFGYGATGTVIQLAIYREYVKRLSPKVVLLVWCNNDIQNILQEIKDPVSNKYIYDPDFSQDLVLRDAEKNEKLMKLADQTLDMVPAERETTLYKILHLHHIRSILEKKIPGYPKEWRTSPSVRHDPVIMKMTNVKGNASIQATDEDVRQYKELRKRVNSPEEAASLAVELITDIKRQVVDSGGEFHVVWFEKEDPNNILKHFKEAGIEVIDASSSLIQATSEGIDIYPLGGSHFNERGYAIIGQAVIDHIANKSIGLTRKNNTGPAIE